MMTTLLLSPAAAKPLPRLEAPSAPLAVQRLIFRLILALADCIAVSIAFRLSYWLRFEVGLTVSPEIEPVPFYYLNLFSVLMPLFLFVFLVMGLYNNQILLGGVREYSKVFTGCTTATMMVIVFAFVTPRFVMSRMWLSAAWLLTFLTVCIARFSCRRAAYAVRSKNILLAPALIVGTNQEAIALSQELTDWRKSGLRVVGFVSSPESRPQMGMVSGLPVVGNLSEIRKLIEHYGIEDVIVAITAVHREELLRLCEEVNGVKGASLRLSSGIYELLTTGVSATSCGGVPLVTVNKVRLERQQAFVKGLLDYAVALLALAVLSPLLIAVAVLIRLDSRGPVIYRRRVLGVGGEQFDAFKFRTMHVDGEALLKSRPELKAELDADHKLKNDPRLTRTGRWLRKYSIDELPQLFNVLRGEMSLVGPRMITAEERKKYGKHRLDLLTVKPGMTGFWQVNGRSDVSYEGRVNLDMYYIRNYSVWLDLQILFVQTLPAVIRGQGAY